MSPINGTRTSGAWNFNGLDETLTYLRFRGRASGGYGSGSESLIEWVQQVYFISPQLTLQIDATSISEGAGAAATTATVTRNTDTASPLTVTLASNDTSEATVPVSVIIAAGQSTSPPFSLDAVDDGIVDGTQTVTITASAAAHADGFDTVDVTDNDTPELTWAIDDESVSESDGPVATIATVSRNTDTTEELTVTLESSDISEITIPAPSSSVTIAAGESTSSPFNIQAIDDDIVDGTQTVTLTASANLYADGASSLDVTDDDVATLFLVLAETSVSEEDGEGATTATVFRNTDTSSELIVSLSFDDTSEATVQASVTIAAGETTSPPFSINAVQDLIEDETQTAILEATADGFVDGTASLEITNSSDTNFYVIPTTGGGTVIIEL
jgi:hypothetical protein